MSPGDHGGVRSSVRINLSIPEADVSVLRWLEAQDNKSVSIRTIIRDDIERHGYTDPLCRPVMQGPKRGRPANASMIEFETDETENENVDDSPKARVVGVVSDHSQVKQKTKKVAGVEDAIDDDEDVSPSLSAFRDTTSRGDVSDDDDDAFDGGMLSSIMRS